eukprot:gene2596-6348_t
MELADGQPRAATSPSSPPRSPLAAQAETPSAASDPAAGRRSGSGRAGWVRLRVLEGLRGMHMDNVAFA